MLQIPLFYGARSEFVEDGSPKDLAGLKRTGVLLNMKRREVQGAVMSVCGSAREAVDVALLVAAGTTTEGQGPPLNTQLSG